MAGADVDVQRAVGIWPLHQRDDTVPAGADVDVQRQPTASQHKRIKYTNCCIYTVVPPDDEQ
jgi:hypothetical protein